jgi:ATP-dependent RNA helicase DeaD
MENFSELKLSPALSQAILEMGYSTPTPIQASTLPLLLEGRTDFLGMAATGTGKTAAFGIPLLERIDIENPGTQSIVLCPTRELAVQVATQIKALGKHKRVSVQAIYGGTGYGEQMRNLRSGVQVIVATPGRLVDYLNKGVMSLETVTTVVLDEADEMISMGFKEDLEFLLKHVPKERCNTWFFAATLSPELRRVADTYLKKPKVAQINRKEMLSGTVKQIFYTVREKNKPKGLCKLIDIADGFYGLIFCQTKALVMELTEYLRARGYRVDCLHGDKTQTERERTLRLFKEKNVNILVCSDVAARGLDVKELTHVINYSLPFEFDSYVHRIGRTGRSGSTGLAMSLVSPQQVGLIARIENVTRSKMEPGIFPTRKEIGQKKLSTLLPKYLQVLGHEKASAILSDEWMTALEPLTKREIAARFLALQAPELFDDRDNAEEEPIGMKDREERNPSPRKFSKPDGRRPFKGGRRPFPGKFKGKRRTND